MLTRRLVNPALSPRCLEKMKEALTVTAVWASMPSLKGGAGSGQDHSCVGIHPVPSRVAWAWGGCLITVLWASIPSL